MLIADMIRQLSEQYDLVGKIVKEPGVEAILSQMLGRLEPVCKIGKQEDCGNGNHGSEIGSALVIAGRNAAKLLEAIDETFNDIALAIHFFVEKALAVFIATMWNGIANMFLAQVLSKSLAGVPFVSHQALGAQPWAPAPPLNRTALQERFCLDNVTCLSGRQQEANQLALPLAAHVDFRGVAAATAS
jgi:hypothetical protein